MSIILLYFLTFHILYTVTTVASHFPSVRLTNKIQQNVNVQ